ncbi:hypothetical protein NMY3_03057 [Candidatus Nitrosocosmicus oleophilus]|uniref:DUF3892 domain-containing protein n=1 Tax=Candidatus Nitrosocosmicus oleophilus TaxID=1353260 RepID=A0A654M087_9ARCH|nr:DUF3892 domain-containing protein [Candidatus Nitrosocosmicus oleophilus]ALI37244.1 hypothetical protein NMY3_03057 [Candidatus Nitrosocosmicus oleophilus]
MDEFEITSVVKDKNGIISHCNVKGYGIQDVSTIERLISEDACSFFIYDGEQKKNVLAKTSNGEIYLTTNASGTGTNGLDFLPLFDEILLRQLIESVR